MKKNTWILIIIIIAILGFSSGFYLIRKWQEPLGMSLGLPTRTFEAESVSSLDESNKSEIQDEEGQGDLQQKESDQSQLTAPIAAAEPVCGGPPVMYILGVGVDTYDPTYLYGLGDVIRVVRVDFIKPKVTVLTLPRDLWVELPDINDKYADTITHGKLNQAYLYGGPGMGYYDGLGGGPGLLARTIALNYGLYVDHYGAVNMAAFERIVNALGGIDIYLDQDWDGRPVDENTVDLGYFYAGQQHMTGEEALRFARIRKKYSEVSRTDNQTLVLCAVKDKLLDPGVIGKIPQLINSLIGTIQTDLSPSQIQQLVCVLSKLEEADLQFVRFPDEMMVQGRVDDLVLGGKTFVWDIPVAYIRQFVRDFENDAIPMDSDGGMSCP